MVAPTKIIAGLGMSIGIEVLDVPKATGQVSCPQLSGMSMAN